MTDAASLLQSGNVPIPLDLVPSWFHSGHRGGSKDMSPKLTVGLPNPSRKQRQRVRLTWTCACSPIKRIEALAWTNATTVRDAMKQILQHPKVIEAACCQTVPTTNTNSTKSISTIEDMCTALLDPDEAKSCISLLHSRSKPGKFGSRSDGACKAGSQ